MNNSWKVALIGAATMLLSVTGAQALDRRVTINNNTSYDMVQFYASNKGTNDWENDILGEYMLPSGNSVQINIDDGSGYCKFDFLAVFSTGDKVVSNNNNVCELSTFTFND